MVGQSASQPANQSTCSLGPLLVRSSYTIQCSHNPGTYGLPHASYPVCS
uniref:Uncharacterized protein n=1 Tax=Picea glauca TaxID=3330 RepID=A0A101M193_PICGL|nr:hypothetical protein ABT39_MTgene4411 [Picea glauca]